MVYISCLEQNQFVKKSTLKLHTNYISLVIKTMTHTFNTKFIMIHINIFNL